MRRFLIVLIALLGLSIPAFAQQDPDDPGIQDSIILGNIVTVNKDTIIPLPVYAITDDSVAYYNVPLRWNDPLNWFYPMSPFRYYSPILDWDEHFESVSFNYCTIRQIGFYDLGGDDNPVLNTNSARVHIWDIPIWLTSEAQPGLYAIDTIWDPINGSLKLGLANAVSEITPGFSGGFILIGEDGTNIENLKPFSFSLSQNYPNPFNSSTEIEFSQPQSGPVSLVIYDIQGREIRRLLDCNLEPGSHSVIWNGLNDESRPVSSGIYFYRLVSNNSTQTNRMTLLK
jgi:hypothetical protein